MKWFGLLLPWRAVRLADESTLWQAAWVHLLAIAVATVGVLGLPRVLQMIGDSFAVPNQMGSAYDDPLFVWISIGLTLWFALLYNGGFALLAAWGAEPASATYIPPKGVRQTLSYKLLGPPVVRGATAKVSRRAWMLSPFAVLVVLLMPVLFHLVYIVESIQWYEADEANELPTSIVPPVMAVLLSLAAFVTTSTFWVMRSRAVQDRCRWPPRCSGCDFSLLGVEGRPSCPECGLPLRKSLKRRPKCVSFGAFGWDFVIRPRKAAYRLHPLSPPNHARKRGKTIALIAATAAVGTLSFLAVDDSLEYMSGWELIAFLLAAGFFAGTAAMFGSCCVATAIATTLNLKHPVSLLPAASAAATFAGPVLVVWTVVLFVCFFARDIASL